MMVYLHRSIPFSLWVIVCIHYIIKFNTEYRSYVQLSHPKLAFALQVEEVWAMAISQIILAKGFPMAPLFMMFMKSSVPIPC